MTMLPLSPLSTSTYAGVVGSYKYDLEVNGEIVFSHYTGDVDNDNVVRQFVALVRCWVCNRAEASDMFLNKMMDMMIKYPWLPDMMAIVSFRKKMSASK